MLLHKTDVRNLSRLDLSRLICCLCVHIGPICFVLLNETAMYVNVNHNLNKL